MSNEPSDQPREHHERPIAPHAASASFSIWWPKTKQGKDLWKLLLSVVAVIGALREFRTVENVYLDDGFFPILVSAATGAAAWYIILVVVRYLAYWFSEGRKPIGRIDS